MNKLDFCWRLPLLFAVLFVPFTYNISVFYSAERSEREKNLYQIVFYWFAAGFNLTVRFWLVMFGVAKQRSIVEVCIQITAGLVPAQNLHQPNRFKLVKNR